MKNIDGDMTEADITVNGQVLSFAESMTFRVALLNFQMYWGDPENAAQLGPAMASSYLHHAGRIADYIMRNEPHGAQGKSPFQQTEKRLDLPGLERWTGPWHWEGLSLYAADPCEESGQTPLLSISMIHPFLMPLIQHLPEMLPVLEKSEEGLKVLAQVREAWRKFADIQLGLIGETKKQLLAQMLESPEEDPG